MLARRTHQIPCGRLTGTNLPTYYSLLTTVPGITGKQLWTQLGRSDVLMLPARYYEQTEEKLRKEVIA